MTCSSTFTKSAAEVAIGVGTLIELAQRSRCGPGAGAPQLLVIAPHRFGGMAPMEQLYFSGKEADATALGGCLRIVAASYGCGFLDAADVVTAGVDGIHLDADNHAKLAAAVQAKRDKILA